MLVTPIVAPELFDRVVEYASAVERDKETSSAPIDFCDNFYGQFFQNRMKQEITGFGNAAKESAVKLRIKVEAKEKGEIVLLITWFERYCDIRYDVFSEEYCGRSGDALSTFQDYLDSLLERIIRWAALEELTDIERSSVTARSALQQALQSVKK
ncbi:MAG TPA: hypothetical protein VFK06_26205 [Candidatus Angelobacter sp.]|nr:hypothetical protein [Candidatus Angelobacter sp.]